MAAMEGANLHHGHHQQQQQQAYPALPASPTLTNPDMILPDYDLAASPDEDSNERGHSPLMMWKNAHAAAAAAASSEFQLQTNNPDNLYGPTGPITPTTPIIYGNGTMLSDIGEVTEVESTAGRPSPVRTKGVHGGLKSSTRGGSGSDTALRSSPTTGYEGVLKKRSKQAMAAMRERRSSMESTSTITTQERQDMFADFDDSISVDDSVFQGDDEESMADSYIEDVPAEPTDARLGIPGSDNTDRLSVYSNTDRLSTYSNTDMASTYSMSSLSRRAEHILANAKKRLTTMEGNLTRARSSLYPSTPSLDSIGSDESTPSPPAKRASTATITQDPDQPASPEYPEAHASLPNDGLSSGAMPYRNVTQRSASALGVSGGYRQPLTASRSLGHLGAQYGQSEYRASWHARDSTLEPLSEDEVASAGEPNRLSRGPKLDQFLSPTFGSFSDGGNGKDRGLQRSVSVAQMRDLKDQVKDLKGKISSLREQARADSLRRRSLQSLRTASPFTNAQVEQWYARPQASMGSEIASANAAIIRNPWNGELSSVDGEDRPPESGQKDTEEDESVYNEAQSGTIPQQPAVLSPGEELPTAMVPEVTATVENRAEEGDDRDDASDLQTEDGNMEDGAQHDIEQEDEVDEAAYDSESGESLYHDTLQHPISHEDREDAFDYEHFFLHSAMGTISQQNLARRGSAASFTSEDSVETTRGPTVESNAKNSSEESSSPRALPSQRRNSDASISTVGTFATADEGMSESGRDRDSIRILSRQSITKPGSGSSGSSSSSETGRKPSYASGSVDMGYSFPKPSRRSTGSITSIPEEGKEDAADNVTTTATTTIPSFTAFRRPISSSAANSLHRPSVSSFESTGTNRSFPLVNRPKKADSVGVLTPRGDGKGTPEQDLKILSESLLSETASVCEQRQLEAKGQSQQGDGDGGPEHHRTNGIEAGLPSALQGLGRDDQFLVERMVAGLGRCVLGLTESGRASSEGRMYRRRIEAARRILVGLDEV